MSPRKRFKDETSSGDDSCSNKRRRMSSRETGLYNQKQFAVSPAKSVPAAFSVKSDPHLIAQHNASHQQGMQLNMNLSLKFVEQNNNDVKPVKLVGGNTASTRFRENNACSYSSAAVNNLSAASMKVIL